MTDQELLYNIKSAYLTLADAIDVALKAGLDVKAEINAEDRLAHEQHRQIRRHPPSVRRELR